MKKNAFQNSLSAMALTLLTMVMSLTTVGCSNDEIFEASTTSTPQEELGLSDAELAQLEETTAANMMLKALCDIDSTSGKTTYTPHVGKVLYSATPTVRYMVADSKEEAEREYTNIVLALLKDGNTQPEHDVKKGDVHLTFVNGVNAEETARIIVDCPRLKDVLTTIIFLPRAVWPENATQATTPFTLLSVWKYLPTNALYICVREPYGCDGIMLSLSNYNLEQRKFSVGFNDFSLYTNCASVTAFDCLADLMKYREKSFDTMVKSVKEKVNANDQTLMMLDKIWNTKTKVTFDLDFDATVLFGNLASLKISRVSFQNKEYKKWTDSYTFKTCPKNDASHSMTFALNYKRNDSEWEKIYQPGGSTRKNRGE